MSILLWVLLWLLIGVIVLVGTFIWSYFEDGELVLTMHELGLVSLVIILWPLFLCIIVYEEFGKVVSSISWWAKSKIIINIRRNR